MAVPVIVTNLFRVGRLPTLVKATGIRTRTLNLIRTGVRVPTPTMLRKITTAYRRIQRHNMRKAGIPWYEAKLYDSYTPDAVAGKIDEARSLIDRLAETKKIWKGNVTRAIARSGKSWERIRESIERVILEE